MSLSKAGCIKAAATRLRLTQILTNFRACDRLCAGRLEAAGYLTKVSKKGNVAKTYEVLLQEGLGGDLFLPMSISDPALFDYAQECVKHGKRVRAYYVDMGKAKRKATDSTYILYQIEVID